MTLDPYRSPTLAQNDKGPAADRDSVERDSESAADQTGADVSSQEPTMRQSLTFLLARRSQHRTKMTRSQRQRTRTTAWCVFNLVLANTR